MNTRDLNKIATVKLLDRLLEQIIFPVLERFHTRLQTVTATLTRLDGLEKRLAEVESHGLRYAGIWSAETSYGRGTAVTFSGSLWIAREINIAKRPGSLDGARSWQLACKRGADGKDLR
jgi:hypothetical protein